MLPAEKDAQDIPDHPALGGDADGDAGGPSAGCHCPAPPLLGSLTQHQNHALALANLLISSRGIAITL